MRRVHYFAYGSNLDEEQMRARCPSSSALFPARLLHHRLEFTHFSTRWRGGAADVVPHFGGAVWGLVYELDEVDLVRLDRMEGGYERVLLDVLDGSEVARRVATYTVRRKGTFRPTPVYLEKMLGSATSRGFPVEYVDYLRSFAL
jgi:gamma-glutamylcyclotransferase (GGCT)/AIG2-like uncharacterized protein YtfP